MKRPLAQRRLVTCSAVDAAACPVQSCDIDKAHLAARKSCPEDLGHTLLQRSRGSIFDVAGKQDEIVHNDVVQVASRCDMREAISDFAPLRREQASRPCLGAERAGGCATTVLEGPHRPKLLGAGAEEHSGERPGGRAVH